MSEQPRARELLARAGFATPRFEALVEPMSLGSDTEDALGVVLGLAGWMLDGLDNAGRRRALDELHSSIEGYLRPEGVLYDSATWLISAERPSDR